MKSAICMQNKQLSTDQLQLEILNSPKNDMAPENKLKKFVFLSRILPSGRSVLIVLLPFPPNQNSTSEVESKVHNGQTKGRLQVKRCRLTPLSKPGACRAEET